MDIALTSFIVFFKKEFLQREYNESSVLAQVELKEVLSRSVSNKGSALETLVFGDFIFLKIHFNSFSVLEKDKAHPPIEATLTYLLIEIILFAYIKFIKLICFQVELFSKHRTCWISNGFELT